MKKLLIAITLIIASLVELNIKMAWSWNDKVTHKDLTGFAADHSILPPDIGDLNSVILWPGQECDDKTHKTNCTVREWLRYGAEKEDNPLLRTLNHFHDPYRDKGLPDILGESALVWAQDSDAQSQSSQGDQSWLTLRYLYVNALTETDCDLRSEKFARLFKGLGHQMHLVQDMAVPAHVRNDVHPLESMLGTTSLGQLFFETWAKKHPNEINSFAYSGAIFPTLSYDTAYSEAHPVPAICPVSQLWDADAYYGTNPSTTTAQGLAEYTNANFFSDDSIFKPIGDSHYYPYPNIGSTNFITYADLLPETIYYPDDQVENVLYLRNQHSDQDRINRFLRVGYFTEETQDTAVYERTFYLDEACHFDYAAKLVPRAVGYSAALLNYFFRGRLQVKSLPFFYNNELNAMRLKITNATPSQEPMGNGTFYLLLRYTPETPEGGTDEDVEDIYVKLEEKTFYGELSDGVELELFFNRQEVSVPLDRWDTVQCILVYSGTLGKEAYAVVASGFTPSGPIFSEEWDQGLTGNHPWISTPDDANDDNGVSIVNTDYSRLDMQNHRFAEFSGPRTNYVDLDLTEESPEGLLMTPETYFQYIIYEMSNIPEDPDASHIIFLKFNNQLALEFSVNGPYLPWSAATGFVTATPGVIMYHNIYSLFDSAGIPVPEPLYLQSIEFLQQIYNSPEPEETQLNMSLESIYFFEEKYEEQN